jgi:hypothetical protein
VCLERVPTEETFGRQISGKFLYSETAEIGLLGITDSLLEVINPNF